MPKRMQVSLQNNVKTFNLTAGKSLPEWLAERRKGKKNTSESRVELLHDLEFPHCARCIWRCPNGTHLFSAGNYPYRLKCFDVTELSMKYSFNADMNILSGVCLSSDYRKFALRGEGRQITVHHSAAVVDRLRVPHAQRCLAYNRFTAELLSSGASHEVHRFNLETGCFVESYKTKSEMGVNHAEPVNNGLIAGVVLTGGCDGFIEAWDSRVGESVSRIQCDGESASRGESSEVRHIAMDENTGMTFACGLESGEVLLYDIRLHRPLLVKNHMNGLPIVKTYFFHGRSTSTGESSFILSADTRSVKVWNKADGCNFTSIEAPGDITDFCLLRGQHNMVEPFQCDDSGVVAICCDVPRVQVHFIPQLGAAPRWATFLENLTEELEEKDLTTVYDDYTFISKEELAEMGVAPTDMADGKIRPSMHGAFIQNNLYRELKAVVDPSGFSRYLKENAQKRKQDRIEDRISRFQRKEKTESGLSLAKNDPRFAKAFNPETAPAFKLDRSNPEYAKLLTTIEERRKKASERRQRYDSSLFSIVPDETHEGELGIADGQPSSDKAAHETSVKQLLDGVKSSGKALKSSKLPKRASNSEVKQGGSEPPKNAKQVTMYEVNKSQAGVFEGNDKMIHAARKKMRADKLSLEERLKRIKKA